MLFAVQQIRDRKMPASVQRRIAAIAHRHKRAGLKIPDRSQATEAIRGARRLFVYPSKAKDPLLVEELKKISILLEKDNTVRSMRDRASIVLGFISGCRRSEVAALSLNDVTFTTRGLEMVVRKSKRDQLGQGRLISIPLARTPQVCAVRALKAWLRIRGSGPGAIFPRLVRGGLPATEFRHIEGTVIHNALQAAAKRIGLDHNRLGAHSLRSGMATAALETGATERAVMIRGGWRDHKMMERYHRPAGASTLDPLARAL
jgi:integrase